MRARILATRWGLTYLQLAVALLVGAAIVSFWSHRLTIECDHARGACVARDEMPLTTEVHVVSASSRLRAREQRSDHGGTTFFVPTWVELVEGGDRIVPLTHVSEGSYRDDKTAMVDQLNAFFAGSSAEVHAAYGNRYGAWPQALLFGVILVAIGKKVTLRACYDAATKELVVERRLLGVLLERASLPASTFRSASADSWAIVDPPRATKAKAFRDRTWGVSLVDEAGALTPLPLWNSRKGLAVQLAATITRTLASRGSA